jgi:hypothetical protein
MTGFEMERSNKLQTEDDDIWVYDDITTVERPQRRIR